MKRARPTSNELAGGHRGDIGTQGTKAALFTEDGTCLAKAFRKPGLIRPAPGTVEEDPERQFASVARAIREYVRTGELGADSVGGIEIDGQMAVKL